MSVSEGVCKDGNSYVPVPNQMATQSRFQEKNQRRNLSARPENMCQQESEQWNSDSEREILSALSHLRLLTPDDRQG